MTKLGELGEFNIIDRLVSALPTSADVVEGAGDDCAVVKVGDGILLVSSDLFLEDTHFRIRDGGDLAAIGWKCAAASLSDIAAMGGVPGFALVSMGFPADFEVDALEEMYGGLVDAFRAYGTALVGGDTTRSTRGVVIDVTVMGTPLEARYLTRKGARHGDVFAVTGYPGRAAAGLHAEEGGSGGAAALRAAHQRPSPRIEHGQWLCRQEEVHALIDLSDGLAQDGGHLARQSGVGLNIESSGLPVDGALSAYCDAEGLDLRDLILSGGEDYELGFAVDASKAEDLLFRFREEFDLLATSVGRFDRAVQHVHVDGAPTSASGYDHFSSAPDAL